MIETCAVDTPNLRVGERISTDAGTYKVSEIKSHFRLDMIPGTPGNERPILRLEEAMTGPLPLLGELYAVFRMQSDDIDSPIVSWQLPNIQTLNDFKKKHLEPHGANSWQFMYGPQEDTRNQGQFTIPQLTSAMRNSEDGKPAPRFLVAREPIWLVHDLRDHVIGQAVQPTFTMDTITDLISDVEELGNNDPLVARKIMENIFSVLDDHTAFVYSFSTNGKYPKERYVLSNLIQDRHNPNTPSNFHLANPMVAVTTERLLRERGVAIVDNMVAWEKENLPDHTRTMWRALGESAVAA